MLCRYCLNYEKGISYSPKKYSNGADYDSRHFTVESSRLPCIFFFFSCAFQQCSTRKQSENELCCSLDLVVGGCILQLNSKNNIYLKKGSITFGLFHILLVLACTALSQCPQKTGGRRPVRQRHC